ncbi:two-component system response regulator [soil metagenome]
MNQPATTHFDPKAARILVVDDEPANLKLLGLMLRVAGYRHVELIQDPREVMPAYRAARPDLILLDINMPHLDGYAVMAQIRALGDLPATQIVVLTAQSGDEVLLRALQGGATDFLNKPFNRPELLARVHNILLAHLAQRVLHGQNGVLERMVAERTQELSESRLDIVRRLGRASEFRDNETGQHILRMSHASALLARRIGWDDAACQTMLNASPMHDVGKIGIPDGILLKPGPLTPDEREVMQTHTTIGAELLSGSGSELLEMARDIAIAHHEKWDGSGYPNGLAGHAIPLAARIVAITDVFDALTSERPYKKPWSVPDALRFMRENAGSHFDPELFEHFVAIVPEVQAIRERFAEPRPDHEAQAVDARC